MWQETGNKVSLYHQEPFLADIIWNVYINNFTADEIHG